MPNSEPPKPPVGDPIKNTCDITFEPPRMTPGDPKKNVVDPGKRDPPKPPVVQK
jgi:hypothetical protein